MSAECPRAARTRLESTRRGASPWLFRTAFIVLRRDASEPERPRAWAEVATTRTTSTAKKTTRTCLFMSIGLSLKSEKGVASPEWGKWVLVLGGVWRTGGGQEKPPGGMLGRPTKLGSSETQGGRFLSYR